MELNLNLDYSTLFSELFPSRSSGIDTGSFDLATYASIRNGGYTKLSISYYGKNSASNKSSLSPINKDNDNEKSLGSIETKAEQMKESADTLISKGAKSLFRKKDITTTAEDGAQITTKDYDRNAIYKGAQQFIGDYNALIQEASSSANINILRQTLSLTSYTNAYSNTLASAGISIGKDHQLSIDEEAFNESDMSTIKTLFNDTNSYAYTVSAKASQIDYYAENEASKENAYSYKGAYSNRYTSGNLFSSYF